MSSWRGEIPKFSDTSQETHSERPGWIPLNSPCNIVRGLSRVVNWHSLWKEKNSRIFPNYGREKATVWTQAHWEWQGRRTGPYLPYLLGAPWGVQRWYYQALGLGHGRDVIVGTFRDWILVSYKHCPWNCRPNTLTEFLGTSTQNHF